jgi:hypothetical protein
MNTQILVTRIGGLGTAAHEKPGKTGL